MALPLKQHGATEVNWIPVTQAALKLGKSVGHLRRMCDQKLRHDNLARKIAGAWHVHAAFDPRLGERRNWRQADLEHLAELAAKSVAPKYIEIAKRRRDIIHGLSQYRPQGTPSAKDRRVMYLAQAKADGQTGIPSVRQLYEWERAYESDGLRALVPAFAFKAASETGGAVGDAALDYLDQILNCGNRVSVAVALSIAKGEAAKHAGDPRWAIGSYRSVLIAVQKRRPEILRRLADKGERAARAECLPKLIRDTESVGAGDQYVGDERRSDVWVRVFTSRGWRAIRPVLTAWEDIRSRVIVGWGLDAHADSNTILATVKRSIAAYGKPLILRTDWGEDYRHATKRPEYKHFDGAKIGSVLDELGIEVRRTAGPYMPYAKPIESLFRTNKTQLDALHSGCWGGCPSERHEDRMKYLKANLEKLPTIDEFRATLAQWIDMYHATPHTAPDMFDKTPMEAMTAFRVNPIRRESDKVLAHLFKTYTGEKLVRRDGIRHMGRWFGNGDSRLIHMQGHRVILAFDVADASRATVCKHDRTPLFDIEELNVRGMTARELTERMREQMRIMRPYKDQAKKAREFILSKSPDDLLRLRAAGLGIPTTPSPLKGERAQGGSVNGRGEGESPAASLRLRTGLEEAIDNAGPAPSDVLPKKAIKSGTDGTELSLDDLIDPLGPSDVSRLQSSDEDISLADIAGEHFDD